MYQRKLFQRMMFVVLVVGLVVMLSGCTSSSKPTQAASERLRGIQNAGKLVIGTALTAPFEFRDAQGKLQGLDVELAEAIAKKLGVTIEWKESAFADVIPAVMEGKVDMAIAGMYITPKRLESVDMSVGYVDTGLVIVTKADNTSIKVAEDLAGKTLCVKTGATGAVYAQGLVDKGIAVVIQEYADTVVSLEELSSGVCDAVMNDKVNSLQYIKTHADLKVASEVLQPAQLGIAVKKGDADMLALINQVIEEMKANKSLEKLYDKWVLGK